MKRRNVLYILMLACSAQALLAKEATKISLYALGSILKKNNRKAFSVTKALYGRISSGKFSNVTKQINEHAGKGVLYVPSDMHSEFSYDPAPGEVKSLDVTFEIGDKSYNICIDESWAIPAWYNFMLSEKDQAMITRTPYIKAEKCSVEELLLLLEMNNKKPFKIISGQYGKLSTQKVVDITRNLNDYTRSGLFMLPENGHDFCKEDPAPQVEKKIKIVFEMGNRWYQVQVVDKWKMSITRDMKIDETRDFLLTRAVYEDLIFLMVPYQQKYIDRLEEVLLANSNSPFAVQNSFAIQPWFRGKEEEMFYDITAAIQLAADSGLLCLPQDMRTFIGGMGTLPYKYIMKTVFLMEGVTFRMTFRDEFFSVPGIDTVAMQDFIDTCTTHIVIE